MKKYLILFCTLFCLANGACSQQTPEEREVRSVADKYLTAFKNLDFAEAEKYGTPNTTLFLATMQAHVDRWPAEEKAQIQKQVQAITIKYFEVNVADSSATVAYQFVEEAGPRDKETLYLFKRDGEWKVDEYIEYKN